MSSSLLEIVELANGEIALRRADEEGEPLLTIRFSSESAEQLREGRYEIAKAMIEAGMDAAADMIEFGGAQAEPVEEAVEERVLH